MKKIELEVPEGKKVEWKEVNGMTVPVLVDEVIVDTRPVTERIKTYEDAFSDLNRRAQEGDKVANDLITDLQFNSPRTPDLLAYIQLRIIAYALNEGWEPQFTTDEYRWYPYYILYTKEEIDAMSEEKKKELWRFGGVASSGALCGLAYSHSNYAWSVASSNFSARLALKSKELAVYMGKQFAEIFKDYVVISRD